MRTGVASAVRPVLPVLAIVTLGACATIPSGPSVMVLPGSGKAFEQFQLDDAICRQWAETRTGPSPQEAASRTGVATAAVGTAIGAGLGAAIGAASGNPGIGAAIGAGGGLLGGTLAGADAAHASGHEGQRRYDVAYQQCMYARGNQIPGHVRTSRPAYVPAAYASPGRPGVPAIPPPPPGYVPAPPPPASIPPPPAPGYGPPPPR
jgi:hypothetical protein